MRAKGSPLHISCIDLCHKTFGVLSHDCKDYGLSLSCCFTYWLWEKKSEIQAST